MKQRILVVDDEHDLCEILRFNLETAGYEVVVAYSAEEVQAHDVTRFQLILLDVMMPGISGFELARQLKSSERTAGIPIIFLTAKDTEEDTLHGFELGADDYVAKPFSLREVLARQQLHQEQRRICHRQHLHLQTARRRRRGVEDLLGSALGLRHRLVRLPGLPFARGLQQCLRLLREKAAEVVRGNLQHV